MEYSNPQIPEGINTSQQHPLREFLLLSAGVLGLVLLLVLIVAMAGERLATWIPFRAEVALAEPYLAQLAPLEQQEDGRYLQRLAERLTAGMELPDGMDITVHYLEGDTVNAFATLGGHVVIYQGLLEKLPHENALAMVLAHEIAHIKLRHPIRSLGRGVSVALLLNAITGFGDRQAAAGLLGEAGLLTLLRFSREQERLADREALAAVQRLYGHVAGAVDLFEMLEGERRHGVEPPQFLSSHPLDRDRIESMQRLALEMGWPAEGEVSPLPWGGGERGRRKYRIGAGSQRKS
jgi:predicted Zn-dependent protease